MLKDSAVAGEAGLVDFLVVAEKLILLQTFLFID